MVHPAQKHQTAALGGLEVLGAQLLSLAGAREHRRPARRPGARRWGTAARRPRGARWARRPSTSSVPRSRTGRRPPGHQRRGAVLLHVDVLRRQPRRRGRRVTWAPVAARYTATSWAPELSRRSTPTCGPGHPHDHQPRAGGLVVLHHQAGGQVADGQPRGAAAAGRVVGQAGVVLVDRRALALGLGGVGPVAAKISSRGEPMNPRFSSATSRCWVPGPRSKRERSRETRSLDARRRPSDAAEVVLEAGAQAVDAGDPLPGAGPGAKQAVAVGEGVGGRVAAAPAALLAPGDAVAGERRPLCELPGGLGDARSGGPRPGRPRARGRPRRR